MFWAMLLMKIGEVMTKNVVVVDYATKVREICRIIQKKNRDLEVGLLPSCEACESKKWWVMHDFR
jgi:CBS domain-containing protein